MLSIEETQDAILATLTAEFVQPIVEQAVPNVQTVKRDKTGKIQPYVAIQFGDMSESGAHSMAGPEGDDYSIPIYVQVIAGVPRDARKLANKVIRVLLGQHYPWSGCIRKRPGGGMWPIVQSDGATEAYLFPASFRVAVQYMYEP